MRPRITRATLAFAALAALLLAVAAASASAAGPVPLEYSGKLLFETPTGNSYPPSRNFGKYKVTLQWVATADTEGSAPWDFKELKGTIHFDGNGNPQPYEGEVPPTPCDATLSHNPAGEDAVNVTPFEGDVTKPEITTQLPLLTELLKSTEEGEDECNVLGAINGFNYAGANEVYELEKSEAGIEAFELALRPKLVIKAGMTGTTPFNFVFNRETQPGAGDPTVIEIHSQIDVGPSAGGSGTTTSPGKPGNGGKAGSKGGAAASCKVPKLVGKKLPAAKQSLTKADCKLGKVEKPKGADLKTAKVVKQKTKPGTILKAGAKVSVKVA
jgi:hypothetical protein